MSGQARPNGVARSSFWRSARRSCASGTSSSSGWSTRIVEQRLPHLTSRASLCGVPGSAASKASAQSSAPSQRSAQGVSTTIGSVGGSSNRATAGSTASTIAAVAFSRATAGSAPATADAPSGTRSRSVQVCTPSSPRLGSTSAT